MGIRFGYMKLADGYAGRGIVGCRIKNTELCETSRQVAANIEKNMKEFEDEMDLRNLYMFAKKCARYFWQFLAHQADDQEHRGCVHQSLNANKKIRLVRNST